MADPAPPTPGCVVTFYSFKGGVGRSFLLANVAATLAGWGYKVLCVDWDLEAPGLDLYFAGHVTERPGGPGLVELIAQYAAGGEPPSWESHVAPVGRRAFTGTLDLMPAGRMDDGYTARVQAIHWPTLYDAGLGGFLEQVRAEWVKKYDFVLIDSRTGITDIGGICTIQLPDLLVPVLAANRQNLSGVSEVVRRAQERRAKLPLDRPGVLVLPILSRFEPQVEYELSQEWLTRVADELGPLTDTWRHKQVPAADLIAQTKMPYVPYWSYGEKLAVLTEPKPAPSHISYPIHSIAALIARRLDDSLGFMTDRDGYLSAARKPTAEPAANRPLRVFLSSTARDLDGHRKAVIAAVARLGERIELVNAESWGASEVAPFAVIWDRMKRCDCLVGLYGFSYRSVLPNAGKSYSEIEYDAAVEDGMPVIPVLLADDAPVLARDIDRGAAAEQINRLRAKIISRHTVSFVKTAEESATAVTTALAHMVESPASPPLQQRPKSRIYISYRRQDSGHTVSRLYDRLTASFGRDSVFIDVEGIPAGVDFWSILSQALQEAGVVLVVIGPNWVRVGSSSGRRRLDDPNDYIRREVETALATGRPVLPVLLDETQMPSAQDLPPSLRKLNSYQSARLRSREFDQDVRDLTRHLSEQLLK